ncbi:type III-B CRISPR module RAMP protein Cmr1 [Endozoicomonas sp. 2B-B]
MEKESLQKLEARYLLSTPVFLGGAESDSCANKIRPPSVKGVLRFWWRALAWSRLFNGDANQTLKQVHQEEGALFGHAAGGSSNNKASNKGCQAAFRLRIHEDNSEQGKDPLKRVDYLLGQGMIERNKNFKYLNSGGCFSVSCYPRQIMTKQQHKELELALLCLGLFGGLGARSRKGFGSLSIQSLQGGRYSAPANAEAYKALVKELLKSVDGARAQPVYSAFSSCSRVDVSTMGKQPELLLEKLNKELQQYRGWFTEEKNFYKDHDWAYEVAEGQQKSDLPKRTVFGLPHNYYLSKARVKVGINADSGRRATPLFCHAHQFEDGSALLVQTLLQSDFLHHSLKVEVSANRKTSKVNADVDWSVIRTFMDRFEDKEVIYGK